MSDLVNESFDGVTAPALPSGWTSDGTWLTDTGAARSGANSLVSSTVDPSVAMFSYNTIAAQADIAASASYLWGALTDADQEAFIGARLNQHTYAGSSCYLAGLQIGPADTPVGLILYKRVSGSNTSLGSVVPTGGNVFAINIWYRITLSLIGSAITVTVQRDSDNNYLTSGGTWQSGATAAISVTDSAVSAAGYVGTIQYESGTPLRYMRVDDFVATYVGGGSSHAGPLVGGALIKSLIGKGLVN